MKSLHVYINESLKERLKCMLFGGRNSVKGVLDVFDGVMKKTGMDHEYGLRPVSARYICDHTDSIYNPDAGNTRNWNRLRVKDNKDLQMRNDGYSEENLAARKCIIMYRKDRPDMFMPLLLPRGFQTDEDPTVPKEYPADTLMYDEKGIFLTGVIFNFWNHRKPDDRTAEEILRLTRGFIDKDNKG